jgi:hypothetical protein
MKKHQYKVLSSWHWQASEQSWSWNGSSSSSELKLLAPCVTFECGHAHVVQRRHDSSQPHRFNQPSYVSRSGGNIFVLVPSEHARRTHITTGVRTWTHTCVHMLKGRRWIGAMNLQLRLVVCVKLMHCTHRLPLSCPPPVRPPYDVGIKFSSPSVGRFRCWMRTGHCWGRRVHVRFLTF